MRRYSLAIPLLPLIAATPALAQPSAGHADASENSGVIIVTASRVTDEAGEIGSAVTVVSEATLKRNQIIFAKDILQDIPGVVIDTDRPGDHTDVSIRGSDNDEVLWLVDGIELGDPSSTSTQYQADHLTSRDIARIEVLRGNQSSLYGSDAIGGVINIITRRAAEEGVKVNAEAEYGSYDTVSGGASLLGKSGPVDFRLSATGYRHGGPSKADPATADPPGSVTEKDEYWRYGFSGRAGLRASDALSFQAMGFWLDSFSDLDSTAADDLDTVRKREYAFAAQGSYQSPNGRFKADLAGSRYVARRLYFGALNRQEGDLYKGTKDAVRLGISWGGDGPISIAAGGEMEWEKTNQITNHSGNFEAEIDTKSVYAELALRPVEGLTLTGAARLDDNSRFGSFGTYRGTIAYFAGPVKFRASYGTGAKAPGLYQLFDPTYGNHDLEVQTSKGGDVGFDINFPGEFTGEITYFFGSKRNEIAFDGSIPPFGGYTQYGRTRADGVEVGLSVQPLPWLALRQTYTYIDHETDVDEDGVYIDSGRPKYIATSSATLTPIERASLTARVRFRDGDEAGYGGDTESYTVIDLLASYDITDRIEVYGRVVNLTDEQYQVSYGTQTLGLSAYGGVRVSF